MPFWTTYDGKSADPKRVSRFRVSVESLNQGGTVWYAKSFTKPSAEITTTAHKYLNHTFNYPGSVKWSPVTLELVDPTNPIDAGGSLAQILAAMGYEIPAVASTDLDFVTISKRKSVEALGTIYVEELNDEGASIEKWELQQPFVTKFEWGSLKYDGDDLNVLKLTVTYDWATCTIGAGGATEALASTEVTTPAAVNAAAGPFFKV